MAVLRHQLILTEYVEEMNAEGYKRDYTSKQMIQVRLSISDASALSSCNAHLRHNNSLFGFRLHSTGTILHLVTTS